MGKILAVIKREYLTRVTSRGFIVWTILTPLLAAGLLLGPALFQQRAAQNGRLVVLDQSGDAELVALAQKRFFKSLPSGNYVWQHETVDAGVSIAPRVLALSKEVGTGQILGFLTIPAEVFTAKGKIYFHTQGLRDRTVTATLREVFTSALIERRLMREGIPAEHASELIQPLEMIIVSDQSGNSRASFFLALGMMTVLYGMIIIYGNLVMRGVIEEKQSRIIEVLLSSIRPFDLMLGKLAGIGLVSLTQVSLWMMSLFVLSAVSAAPAFASSSFKLPQFNPVLVFFFFVFFLLGYFLFSTLYLVVGAMVSAEEDAQQLQMPVMLSAVIPMLLLEQVMRQPHSLFSTVLSLVPLFSPILMFGRISVSPPPLWQIGLSILLLLAAIYGAVWLAAKIYRVGVLMYGKPPTLPELFKWLKYS
jgi:ABC-2 type transport system permease protein